MGFKFTSFEFPLFLNIFPDFFSSSGSKTLNYFFSRRFYLYIFFIFIYSSLGMNYYALKIIFILYFFSSFILFIVYFFVFWVIFGFISLSFFAFKRIIFSLSLLLRLLVELHIVYYLYFLH